MELGKLGFWRVVAGKAEVEWNDKTAVDFFVIGAEISACPRVARADGLESLLNRAAVLGDGGDLAARNSGCIKTNHAKTESDLTKKHKYDTIRR